MDDIIIEKIDLKSSQRKNVENFLNIFSLKLDDDVEYTAAAIKNGEIIGTCSFTGNVLKCFAVKHEFQDEGIASKLLTHITDVEFDRGIYDTFIFTKEKNKSIFEGMGYRAVYSTGFVILLEGGTANVKKYVNNMVTKNHMSNNKKAAVVMNCNPFTLGHRYIVEKASSENEEVVVYVVEENRSVFPFDVRLELAIKGLSDLKNVKVIPGGKYIISSLTFPSYFIKKEDERLNEYTKLDAGIFGKYIAPEFNINKRYIGCEPNCNVTNAYNNTLYQILPDYNVDVKLVERLMKDGTVISASDVRKFLMLGDLEKVKEIVPVTTYEFLISDKGREITSKMRNQGVYHA